MPEAFSCTSCGAPLEVRRGETVLRCPFCNNTVSLPENAAGPAMLTGLPAELDMQSLLRLKEVRDLARQGRTIDAIKIYREITNVGLKEAKDAVDAMAAGQPLVLTGANVVTTQAAFSGDPGEVTRQVEDLLRRNQKIEAIRVVREATNLGLKEAKDAVERVEAGMVPAAPSAYTPSEPAMGPNPFDVSPARQGGKWGKVTCLVAVAVALATLGCSLAAWLFLGNVNF
jgi:LSD1 subclass zinc finger protein